MKKRDEIRQRTSYIMRWDDRCLYEMCGMSVSENGHLKKKVILKEKRKYTNFNILDKILKVKKKGKKVKSDDE